MKSRDYYQQANERIIPTEQLKRKTKNTIAERRKKPKYIMVKLANVAIVFVFVLSVLWLADEHKYQKETNLAKITIPTQEKNDPLDRVENLETLKKLVKQASTKNALEHQYFATDAILETESSWQDKEKNEAANKDQSYSETNVQVENVDEADIVKTDGEYIYYVANNQVSIIEAEGLKVITKLEYSIEEFQPQEIFLTENRLVVVGRKSRYTVEREALIDCIMPTSGQTMAMVYDITNKQSVIQLREIAIEGDLISSRMVGDNVYLIANRYIYIPYHTNIDDLTQTDLVPCYKDSVISENNQEIALADIAYFPEQIDNASYLILASFNVKNQEEIKLETILGGGNNVYCSEENIYVAKTKYNYNLINEAKDAIGMNNQNTVRTEIYQFALNNGSIAYRNKGNVPGYIINQFSMDEYNGYFRIATTKQSGWNTDNATNGLYVLDKNLNTIGKLENLAKGERIYSVRFMGEKAYVVTFKQTDPLFVIDLSTPVAPIVLGELKIPGYSQYLHPYDETHLIGFGYNTETVDNGYGEIVKNTGMKMALFDVTDVANPKELFKVDIGTTGTYSEILNNHKALLFSKEKDIIAFPITVCTTSQYRVTFQGAIVYGLDLNNGFTERAKIANKEVTTGDMEYDYYYAIERILYIGDNLYTLSKSLIKKIDSNTMQVIGQMQIK